MARSRKDSRGYALRTGESQRKDGRYSFSYTDKRKKRHIVYAATLVDLRKKEKSILRDLEDGIDPSKADYITINEVFDLYMKLKHNLKETTRNNYLYMYNHFVRDGFGKNKISKIKYTDIVDYYYSIILEDQMKASTLEGINTLLHPTFQLAVRDGIIRVNPTTGVMSEIKRSNVWNKEKRVALTIDQQRAFVNYLNDSKDFLGWKPVLTVLLGTGMRIGECLGLRWTDLDFEKRMISVNHTLCYACIPDREGNKIINTTKTESGNRTIPMIDEVYDAFLEEYTFQSITGFCHEKIDDYEGFVFASATGNVLLASEVNKAISRIVTSYNKEEKEVANKEKREPTLLPEFSAHILRHTFCTRFCENETNVKVIQTIMGHSDIKTTLDIYADVTDDKKQEVLLSIQNKIFC